MMHLSNQVICARTLRVFEHAYYHLGKGHTALAVHGSQASRVQKS